MFRNKLIFRPAKLCCECCGTPFEYSMIVYRDPNNDKTYCPKCLSLIKILRHDGEEELEEYLYNGPKAYPIISKENLCKFPSGCYEIGLKETGEDDIFYAVRPIRNRAERKNIGKYSFLLKKVRGCAAVILPKPARAHFLNYSDVITVMRSRAMNDYLRFLLKLTDNKNVCYITADFPDGDDNEQVVGLANINARDFPAFIIEGGDLPFGRLNFVVAPGMSNLGDFEICGVDEDIFPDSAEYDDDNDLDDECDDDNDLDDEDEDDGGAPDARSVFARKLDTILKTLTPRVMLDYISSRIRGQEKALKSAVYLVYTYLRSIADGKDFTADSWMLTAPSGSGKTEFYRSVRDLFKKYGITIPVAQIDLSQITEAGFKGNNVDTIVKRLTLMNPELGGYAICFLDEADKKFCPSYTSKGDNVNAAVQSNLLTLVEGSEQKVEDGDRTYLFNTSKTMFVFMGAFQEIRDSKHKKKLAKGMGFGSEQGKKDFTAEADESFYEGIEIQDMIDYGMLEELAGRVVRVVSFEQLPESEMAKLIRDKARQIGSEYSCRVRIADSAVEEIVAMSYGTIGIRKPINCIKQLIQDALTEAMFGAGYDKRTDTVVIGSATSTVIERGGSRSSRPEENEG